MSDTDFNLWLELSLSRCGKDLGKAWQARLDSMQEKFREQGIGGTEILGSLLRADVEEQQRYLLGVVGIFREAAEKFSEVSLDTLDGMLHDFLSRKSVAILQAIQNHALEFNCVAQLPDRDRDQVLVGLALDEQVLTGDAKRAWEMARMEVQAARDLQAAETATKSAPSLMQVATDMLGWLHAQYQIGEPGPYFLDQIAQHVESFHVNGEVNEELVYRAYDWLNQNGYLAFTDGGDVCAISGTGVLAFEQTGPSRKHDWRFPILAPALKVLMSRLHRAFQAGGEWLDGGPLIEELGLLTAQPGVDAKNHAQDALAFLRVAYEALRHLSWIDEFESESGGRILLRLSSEGCAAWECGQVETTLDALLPKSAAVPEAAAPVTTSESAAEDSTGDKKATWDVELRQKMQQQAQGKTWADVRITLASDTSVKIRIGAHAALTASYEMLGMRDQRHGDKANLVWALLKDFCNNHGYVGLRGQEYEIVDRKRRENTKGRLSKQLKSLFGIRLTPIYYNNKKGCYCCYFKAEPG